METRLIPLIEPSRTKNSIRNIIWAVMSKALTVLMPFVTRTFLIYGLGTEYLGLSSLYTSILQVLNLAELGFSSAVVYSMYKPVAESDKEKVAALLNYFKNVYRAVGAVILVLGLALLPVLDLLVSGDVPEDVSLKGAYLIYLANTVVSYFLFAYRQSLLNAYQRNDVINKILITVAVCQNLLQIAFLVFIPNFYTFAIVIPLATIANNCLTALVTNWLFPEYSDGELKKAKLNSESRAGIRKRVAGLLIQKICGVTRDSFDSIVISAFLGLVTVGLYNNYFMIMSGVLGILETIGPAIGASVGNSIAAEDTEKNFRDMRKFVYMYAMISGVAVACLLAVFQPFMEVWMGAERMLPIEIVVLLCIYFYIRTMGDIRAIYADAAGIWWEQRWRAFFESVANLVLNIILVQVIGLPGVVLATIISLFLFNFCYGSLLLFKHYFKNGKAHLYYLDHGIYALSALAICVVVFFTSTAIPLDGISGFVSKLALALVLGSLLEVLLYFKTKRFKEALSFAKNALKRR